MENAQKKVLPVRIFFLFWNIIGIIFLFTICCTAIATQRHEQASPFPEIFCTSGSFSRIPRGIAIVSRVRDKSADLATTDPNRIKVVVLSCGPGAPDLSELLGFKHWHWTSIFARSAVQIQIP